MKPIKICLFCGSRSGSNYQWSSMADELGKKIGNMNGEVVYGGGRWGLMGEIAEASIKSGSKVTGVITHDLLKIESSSENLDKLFTVDSMTERKSKMIEMADIFLVLPGGIGTLDELFDVWTTRQLKQHKKPIILLNYDNYFEHLISFAKKAVAEGFMTNKHKDLLKIVKTVDEAIFEILEHQNNKSYKLE